MRLANRKKNELHFSGITITANAAREPSEKCGQAVADCIGDAYGNHGWTSVYLTVQIAFIPWTAAGITGACALLNC